MTREEFEHKIRRKASIFQVGGFRPSDDPLASWVGRVNVAMQGEDWPEWEGSPMVPICQLNLKEVPYKPALLEDIEMITLFMNEEHFPDDTPNGEGWLLRAYKDSSQLVALQQPEANFQVNPFQLKAEHAEKDYPGWEDCPEEPPEDLEDEYSDHFETLDGIKVGGWPRLIQSEIFWAPDNLHPAKPEYVFQIDSIYKANWAWGDNGVAYFGRGTADGSKDEWTFSWQCM